MVAKKIDQMSLEECEKSFKATTKLVNQQQRTMGYHDRIDNKTYNSRVKKLDSLAQRINWFRKIDERDKPKEQDRVDL